MVQCSYKRSGNVNSMAPVRRGSNFTCVFKPILQMDISITSCEIVLRWVPQNTIDNKSTLIQVIAWHWQVNLDIHPNMALRGHNELMYAYCIYIINSAGFITTVDAHNPSHVW